MSTSASPASTTHANVRLPTPHELVQLLRRGTADVIREADLTLALILSLSATECRTSGRLWKWDCSLALSHLRDF